VSMPLPAAVAAALVLAIGVALTATLASLPQANHRTGLPMSTPVETLAVEPAPAPAPSTATRAPVRVAPVG
jgi:hypothetical protein